MVFYESAWLQSTFVQHCEYWSPGLKTFLTKNIIQKGYNTKTECCHDANFVITGGTIGCCHDNMLCPK